MIEKGTVKQQEVLNGAIARLWEEAALLVKCAGLPEQVWEKREPESTPLLEDLVGAIAKIENVLVTLSRVRDWIMELRKVVGIE